jgi:hypothetical protein
MSHLLRFTLLLMVVSFLMLGSTQPAAACSCIMPGTPVEEMDRSAAVFSGKVVHLDTSTAPIISSADPVVVGFDVSTIWKGPQEAQLAITTARSSASCGFEFQLGVEYIVYAYEGEVGLETGLCTRTAPLAMAADDLAALGEGVTAPEPEPAPAPSRMPWLIAGGVVILGAILLGAGLFLRQKPNS